MNALNYILEGHNPVPETDTLKWGIWMEENSHNRVVNNTLFFNESVRVSTVFLGLDHGWDGSVKLFETMVFGGPSDGDQDRCATWEQAITLHDLMCRKVNNPPLEVTK